MRKIGFPVLILGLFILSFSFTVKPEKVGVLILAHGGSHSSWDEAVKDATKTLQKDYIVEVAFGMASPAKMQIGIDNLESQGVTKIVVVPLFISSYSPIIRQNEYLLGLRDSLADAPMLMDHGSYATNKEENNHDSMQEGSDHDSMPMNHSYSTSKSKKKIEMKPLKVKAEIILTKPLDAHSLVAEILYDRISELSIQPENETILIVAHGPRNEEDNKNWVRKIENLADQIRMMQSEKGTKFKQLFGLTVRDDADSEIYDQAKEQLRMLVSQSGKDGEVIVIPLLLSQGGVEKDYVARLEGLTYKWSGKTLLPHPNITKFIQVSVEGALK